MKAMPIVVLAVAGIVLGTWAGGYIKLPPATPDPKYTGKILSPESDRVLRMSCYNCHSNEARYEWYDYMPVALPLVAMDVINGRKELNFSLWDQYPDVRRARKLREMKKEIEEGDMPPWYYTPMHKEAALSAKAKQLLLADLSIASADSGSDDQPAAKAPVKPKAKSGH